MPKAEKVTIIGGGLGAVTAAYALTDPQQKKKYDITIYTMGWRLGGKGASGRNADIHDRIEEHGLHIWFGCYDNAFTMMRQIYDEIDRPKGTPLATLDEAFHKQSTFALKEHYNGKWHPWTIEFPTDNRPPGGKPSVFDFLAIIQGWILKALEKIGFTSGDASHPVIEKYIESFSEPHKHKETLPELRNALGEEHAHGLLGSLKGLFDIGHSIEDELRHLWNEGAAAGIKLVAELVWPFVKTRLDDDEVRQAWRFMYLGMIISRGILLDDLSHKGVDSINDIEGRDWFRKFVCFDDDEEGDPNILAIDSPQVRSLYDACFAYREGDITKPDFSAAALLRACLWLPMSYKGAFCYEMQAGMGDTVFTPFYEALSARGVKFEFFSEASGLHTDALGDQIESVSITRQVTLNGDNYNPLVKVKDLLCWPNKPQFDQIEQGAELEASGCNLEHYGSGWKNVGPTFSLKRGEGFDHVILAAPLPTHMNICPDLVQSRPAWRKAVEKVQAVRTLAAQLWFIPTREQLGVKHPPAITGSYAEPWASLADFSHLIPRERWGDTNVNYLNYTCNAMPDTAGSTQEEANAYILKNLTNYLENHSEPLWPTAVNDEGEFDWNVLWSEDASTKGEDRLKSQYLRANIDPNELYILCTARGMNARPKTQAAGLTNLYFSGDWTDNGFNISSVEGTVMSGLQASRALSGFPQDIVGEDPKSLTPSA